MRNYKFRYFDKLKSKMEDFGGMPMLIEELETISDRENMVVMQYTGLTDQNGVEIYEGDIVKNGRGAVMKVKFVDGAFYAEGKDPLSKQHVFSNLSDFSSWTKVIGNIYENPELLEESK